MEARCHSRSCPSPGPSRYSTEPGLRAQGGVALLVTLRCRDSEHLRFAVLAAGRVWWQKNVLHVLISRLEPPEWGSTAYVEKVSRSSS